MPQIVCICSHCGVQSAPRQQKEDTPCPMYCSYCSTEEKRKEMDKENEELGIICQVCNKQK